MAEPKAVDGVSRMHEPLEWGINCLSAPDRGPHECAGYNTICTAKYKHVCCRCGAFCLCQDCNEGRPRVQSSVSEAMVHTDTPIGRTKCIDPPVVSPKPSAEPSVHFVSDRSYPECTESCPVCGAVRKPGDPCASCGEKPSAEQAAPEGKRCIPCNETGLLHCSDPANCDGPWSDPLSDQAPVDGGRGTTGTLDVERAENWLREQGFDLTLKGVSNRYIAELLHNYSLSCVSPAPIPVSPDPRVEEIRKRLDNYSPRDWSSRADNRNREFWEQAPDDIRYLLRELDRLKKGSQ